MNPVRRHILKTFFVLLAAAVFFAVYQTLAPLNSGAKETMFRIERGQGSWEIARILEREQFIRSAFFFEAYTFLRGAAFKLQAGDYVISKANSAFTISNKFIAGDTVKNRITIIEGWNIREIADYLESRGIAPKEEVLAYKEHEGYLFPDTYEIAPEASVESIISLMRRTFDEKVGSVSQDVIIMASMIEKEVQTKEDKELVAGILWKRLEIGLALQIDATVNYITGKKTSQVSITDTQIDSPYNTYKYRGLPEGPISNP